LKNIGIALGAGNAGSATFSMKNLPCHQIAQPSCWMHDSEWFLPIIVFLQQENKEIC
jgi:hypothetical protein